MKFTEIPYERPDLPLLSKAFDDLFSSLSAAKTTFDQKLIIDEIYKKRSHFETMSQLASIHNSIDTTNEFYEAEQKYFDENYPVYLDSVTKFYKALLSLNGRQALERIYGEQLFRIAAMSLKTFSPQIIGDLQRENELVTAYTKLLASASVEFEGKKRNLSEMLVFRTSAERPIRKAASQAVQDFFASNQKAFDDLFDELVHLRNDLAKKLGFENFIKVGYLRMLRSDYHATDVSRFRNMIVQHVVPVAQKIRKNQQERLQLDHFLFFDEELHFINGNAKPQGTPETILNYATRMYNELSPETGKFFQFLTSNELLDVINRPHKAPGGYCTFLSETKSPFIFSNFNGTSGDVDVLTHEAGHAFQSYSSRDLGIEEYFFPTSEAAEIHSMSMEFLTHPWMNLFFAENADKYFLAHVSSSVLFLPYGAAVDEFQHIIYENPSLKPAGRHTAWRNLEKKYLPDRKYEDLPYLEAGGFWQRQQHIYRHPFYYIDYTLALFCAFQFWIRSAENREQALDDYIHLCKLGGSKSFLELVKAANLKSPFDEAAFSSTLSAVDKWLDQFSNELFGRN